MESLGSWLALYARGIEFWSADVFAQCLLLHLAARVQFLVETNVEVLHFLHLVNLPRDPFSGAFYRASRSSRSGSKKEEAIPAVLNVSWHLPADGRKLSTE